MKASEDAEMRRPRVPRDEPLISRTILQRMAVMTGPSFISVFGYFLWRVQTGAPVKPMRSESSTLLTNKAVV